ncbi:hypothetical protein EKL30_02040 [Candidimonas sp. SYP-B2681]|uniref:YhaN family protein n=1 Tax=Candidimonas sp. SYP-B2681 TaxID=2497686 RepID=UPI000F86B6CA|nr:YhaN family protein [Candidimonas sp. SYP-B2681]RTZ47792.1 hypothetical protein EKL30_02040 [Candidimonas sp. SYP-B2681]
MRFNRLDLVRYGKFTDRRIEFPDARCDFHMVVGPNEAGKSTLRQAFFDLLFGFHARTPLDFLHAKSELRIAAAIKHDAGTLEFQRVKGNKNTLRAADDTPLPDTLLENILGTTSSEFFDKMFGLDHPRLVQGGNDMLKAQDDVGQVLFQAAAGVAGLGKVYEALQAEASSLWAPKKSRDRLWYSAQAQLDEANAALKAATVRTREWSEANERVQDLQDAAHAERERHQTLLIRRTQLERVRRLAPSLTSLIEYERALNELGAVIELPADAGAILASAELELAKTEQRLATHGVEAARLDNVLAGISFDRAILDARSEIENLEVLRHRYGAHAQNIQRYEGEVEALWKDAVDAATQLGWPSDLVGLQERLPSAPCRRHVEQLLHEHSSVVQALESSQRAVQARQAEIDTLSARLANLSVLDITPALRAALHDAMTLGEPEAAIRKADENVSAAQEELDRAMQAMGSGFTDLSHLAAVQAPSSQTVAGLVSQRLELLSDLKTANARYVEIENIVQERELAIRQYRQMHHPITKEDVWLARQQRNDSWQALRNGDVALAVGGPPFQQHMQYADEVADARLDNVQEAAELQSRQHQLESELLKREHAEKQCQALNAKLRRFDENWSGTCRDLGLPEMPVNQLADWLTQKDSALDAAYRLTAASQELETVLARQSEIRTSLRGALMATGLSVGEASSISVLRIQANDYVGASETGKARRDALTDQLAEARSMLLNLQQTTNAALSNMEQWQQDWSTALRKAGLPDDSQVASAESALSLMELISVKLQQIRQRRVEHIDVMRNELSVFADSAERLASLLAATERGGDPVQISRNLNARLTAARQAQEYAASVGQELDHIRQQIREAQDAILLAGASVRPLLEQSGSPDKESLRKAISRSDRYRSLVEIISATVARLLELGDGYTREQIQAEIEATDLTQLAAEMETLNADITLAASEQTRLAVELAAAVRDFDAISGTDVAARAEAKRQEALAQMANAAERYIKVYTAARLLRWSIDRYREQKQGPMLSRAGEIFSQLTEGSFERLAVDFDREPMVLEGVRSNGSRVAIAGLSDGTRDQLYLALRLAALDLHLQKAKPLPFIADDLFINYDDARARAGLQALATLSQHTQVIFLSHHDHLVDTAKSVFGKDMNIVLL